MRRITFLFAAALLALSASLTVAGEATKSQSAKSKSSNEPAYGGYCPVAYAAMNKAVKGDPKQSLTVNGHKLLFSSADAKKLFDGDVAMTVKNADAQWKSMGH